METHLYNDNQPHVDWGDLLCRLAVYHWGEPDQRGQYEWRWGNKGGRKIDPVEGTWFDFPSDYGGGALDFVIDVMGAAPDNKSAFKWLIENSYVEAEPHAKSRAAYAEEQARRAKARRERDAEAEEKVARVQAIWDAAEPVSAVVHAEGLVAAYLRQRRLFMVPILARVLPNQASWNLGVTGAPGYPCIVWPIVDIDGEVVAIEVMALHPDGRRAWDPPRKTFGSPPRGGYIPLHMPDAATPLIVGEGCETVLSGIEATGFAGVACTSAGLLSDFVPPDGISEVIVAVDNDQAGRDALDKLAPRLLADGIAVRWLRYPAERENYDWNDALMAGRDLAADIEAAPYYEAQADAEPEAEQGSGDGSEAGGWPLPPSMDEFLAVERPKVEALLEPFIYRRASTTLHGPSGATKTRFALSLAYALAAVEPFIRHDWVPRFVCNVLFLDAELRAELLAKWLGQLGPGVERLRVLSRDDFLRLHGRDFTLAEPACRDALYGWVDALEIDVVVIDSRWMAFDIHNLKDEDEGAKLVAEVLRGLRQHGAATLLIDHDNKSGQISGFTTKTRFDDVVFQLEPEAAQVDGITQLKLTFDKDRHQRKIQPLKLAFWVDDERVGWEVLGEWEPKPKRGGKSR